MDLMEINQPTYAATSAIADKVGEKPKPLQRRKKKQAVWEKEIEKGIRELRRRLSLLSEIEKNPTLR